MSDFKNSNMAWSDESLILFFYNELDTVEAAKLAQELKDSEQLQQRYQSITNVLTKKISSDIPQPSDNLNQNVMAAVYRSIDSKSLKLGQAKTHSVVAKPNSLMSFFSGIKMSHVFPFGVFVVLGFSLFYMGRYSVDNPNQQDWTINERNQQEQKNQQTFSHAESQRVLYASLEKHLNASTRLLTNVINADDTQSSKLSQRNQHLDELISFNRLYRQIITKSGDKQLSHLLMQMESILLELRNSQNDANQLAPMNKTELDRVKQRLDNSDLLFKLKVSNKKIQQRSI